MSGMSDYLKVQLIKHMCRTGSYPKPTVYAIALFTTDPTDAGTGTEVSGGSYARVDVPPLDANWAASSGTNGLTSNVSDITFPAPSGANWGDVTHIGIYDALTGGNLLFSQAMIASRTINDGATAPVIEANAITLTLS